jgi:hypothetical protein
MSGARFQPLHRHSLMRRAAVVGLAFILGVVGSCWLPMFGADDRGADPQAAAELAVRKRILANWQARQDRVKSFYVAWKTGPDDHLPQGARASLPGIHQVWVASDGRFREEFSNFLFGDPLAVGRQEEVFDGHSVCRRWLALKLVGADGTLRDVPVGWFPSGTIAAPRDLDDRRIGDSAVSLSFRPLQSQYGDWTLENSRVTSQNAIVGRQHYIRIAKSNTKSKVTEACWVDPARDDLVIHFQREFSDGSEEWTSFEYKQDPRHGWMLTRWQGESRDVDLDRQRKSTADGRVREYKINVDFPPERFQFKFPAGTFVFDSLSKRDYFVRRDGSQRTCDRAEMGKSITYQQLVNEDTTRPAKP